MNTSIFTQKPAGDTCDCIICHKKAVQASDEHIIPKSLGGYIHSWKVCKTCNSTFGNTVDKQLINHFFIQWERFRHQLKGESKAEVKNPFEGTFAGDDGEPYRVMNENGKLVPHILKPKITISPDGKSVSVAIDPATKNPEKILEKVCKDSCIPFDPTSVTKSIVKEADTPWLTIKPTIDLSLFRIGILKIAYEFTAELIPEYLSDREAVKFSDILEHNSYERIDEIEFGGNGITDIFPMLFNDFIDFSNEKRHYILLTNVSGKMHCFIKLFNVFCLGIKMSDIAYEIADKNVILINDFGRKSINLLTLKEFVTMISVNTIPQFRFYDDLGSKLQVITGGAGVKGIGFYAAPDGQNLCFAPNGFPQGSLTEVLPTIPEYLIETRVQSGKYITIYHIEGLYYFCLAPSCELIPVKEIILETTICKL